MSVDGRQCSAPVELVCLCPTILRFDTLQVQKRARLDSNAKENGIHFSVFSHLQRAEHRAIPIDLQVISIFTSRIISVLVQKYSTAGFSSKYRGELRFSLFDRVRPGFFHSINTLRPCEFQGEVEVFGRS